MTIYVDLLFVLNLVINALVLSGAAVLARERLHHLRLLSGAAIGAFYSVLMFFPKTGILFRVGARLAVGALMVAVGISVPSFKRYLRALLWFFLSLGVFGGGMYLFYSFTAAGSQMVMSGGIYYVDMPLWLLLSVSFGFYGLIRLTALWQHRHTPSHSLRSVEICFGGKYRTLTAFVDTGNTLSDPLTLACVIVVEAQALRGVLPETLLSAVKAGDPTCLDSLHFEGIKCRLLPFRGVGESGGMLLAVRPDWVRLLPRGEPMENVLLGLSAGKMSEDGTYQALLGAVE